MHDHYSPFSMPSLPDPPPQWLILVFRTCPHHQRSFSQRLFRVQHLDPRLVPPLWDGLSHFMEPSQTRLPPQWLILVFRTCPHHRGSFSQRLLRVQLLDPRLVPPLWDGLSHFMEPSQTRLPRHTSLPCCYCIFACSASSFDLPWLLPSRFSSHAPGKHRLVFVV
jgi:hypothetical protein